MTYVLPDRDPLYGRIPVTDPSPLVDGGLRPAKAYAGEVIPFAATVFREGHDRIGAELRLTDPSGHERLLRMHMPIPGTDRYQRLVRLDQEGFWTFRVEAWADDWATWLHAAEVKIPAGLDVEVTLLLGAELLERAAAETDRPDAERALLSSTAKTVRSGRTPALARFEAATAEPVWQALSDRPLRRLLTIGREAQVEVERTRAGLGAWYELFPRSEGAVQAKDGSWKSGTFRTAAKRLAGVAEMGFDVVYLPPIHPIGEQHRKGANNSLNAKPGEPGSPWAVGGPAGGHDAVHPDLGSLADFDYFVATARKHHLEVALDLALQASPDHPWVKEHPEWFTTLPDGTIAYAENPPKKYQDIYPLNFDNDPQGLGNEVLRIVRFWAERGIRIFRVDNPHTKPIAFWEWLIASARAEFPDLVFLAEAFTRPAMLHGLAKIGFQQSYNYFAWRNTKAELTDYLTELSRGTEGAPDKPRGSADFLRPALWVNTPDILTEYLQFGGRPAYKVRAAIAATAAPTWGMYAGYELVENVARPGSEENIDNEKYQYRPRNWARAEKLGVSLAPYITVLNRARRAHPALQQLRNLRFHWSDDDQVLVYSKYLAAEHSPTGVADTIIVVANLDPHAVRETTVHLDMPELHLPDHFPVRDLITGAEWQWGAHNFVHLDPFQEPVHVLEVLR